VGWGACPPRSATSTQTNQPNEIDQDPCPTENRASLLHHP
jgi:hypothetical protein